MRIVACIKQVPSASVTPRIAESRDRVEEDGLSYEVNETDLYAIEEALYQRSVHRGSVVAVTVGPARAKEALHVAYAKGVDHAVHVVDETFKGASLVSNVRAVTEVVKTLGCDMILAGIQADDDLSGRFGVALAESLGVPVITAVTEIQLTPERRIATVTRELGEGRKQELEVSLPCVLTVQFGIRPLRYTPVLSIVKARARKIESMTIESLGIAPDEPRSRADARVIELFYPEESQACVMLTGSAREVARQLVERLLEEGLVQDRPGTDEGRQPHS
jgi:electron transfer flavoprotein beta subunit